MIGYGSIGRGLLPLLLRHAAIQPEQITIIDPNLRDEEVVLKAAGYTAKQIALTPENYETEIRACISHTSEQALLINVAVEVSSVALIALAREINALYIDTVVEPWPGHYCNASIPKAKQTNYALRESLLALQAKLGPGPTAVSCCGANPGMVSWLVKEALLNLAKDTGHVLERTPTTHADWAHLMADLGVKGIHIAERDSQVTQIEFPDTTFTNTWSVDGLIAEALQPAELGWGTHEVITPSDAHSHEQGSGAAIYLDTTGATTRVSTWVPSHGSITSFLVTHNEAISLSDYFTLRDGAGNVLFRPTCHYAYHPSDRTVTCLKALAASGLKAFNEHHVLLPSEISAGADELGVLLYGHSKNAYWYGSKLDSASVGKLAPAQNATGLQVSSALLAGICWIIRNRTAGIVEVETMDHQFCLKVQLPYLGDLFGAYTDWQPASKHHEDPWQFVNVRQNDAP